MFALGHIWKTAAIGTLVSLFLVRKIVRVQAELSLVFRTSHGVGYKVTIKGVLTASHFQWYFMYF